MVEGTRLTLRHEDFNGRPESCRTHSERWAMVLQWLEQHFGPKPAAESARFFLFRLLAPRPTFPKDMTTEEAAVMQEHFQYWTTHSQSGTAIVYGPGDDPKGVWGLAVVRVADEDAVRALEAGDPAIRARRGFHYEIFPMLGALVSGRCPDFSRSE